MTHREAIDPARRRLAALLLGTPLAGALQAAPDPSPNPGAPPAAPADAPAGGDFTGRWVHAYAAYGAPKYGPDFTHFDYVQPRAPVGGTIRLRNPDRRSSFDKYNPWTTRGNAPAGVLIWMVEGLCHLSQDEPMSMYGLLAEALWVEPDLSAVTFRLRPEARFSNGDPVLAEDVRHSFEMLSGKGASPAYQTAVAGIARVRVRDARTVRFEFKEASRDQVFVAGTLPVFSRKWGQEPGWAPGQPVKPFEQIVTELPITSGPYVIDKIDMPRRIEFRRNPDYWARNLPVRCGHFNFERVVYRNYQDNEVAFEAFKAGEFDLYKEYASRAWVRKHKGVKWEDKRILKESLDTGFGQQLQSYQLNLRRPKFQDLRVREALGYTYDFDTLNKTGVFTRASSVFNNSEFAARGTPGPGELKLLEPFRAELPPRVFGPAFVAPSTANNPKGLRQNLLKARALFEEAGCKLGTDGKLRLPDGEPLVIEYMVPRTANIVDWQRNLKKLGVELNERLVDFALYRRRLEQYDFDMVVIVEGRFTLPAAADQAALYGSKSADEPGNSNYRGVKSRALDAVIEAMNRATTLDELRDAARAMDRIVMWNFWQIPDLWAAREPISFWNKFGRPAKQPPYFQADTLISGFVEWGPWPLWTWWDQSLPLKAA
ncbi:MAG: ABC transporter substrate-binding protein [Betaproteobacteria bacterium]|nr:ABC transporter substrate-binding protein [Betaproteobacteria bacterium]